MSWRTPQGCCTAKASDGRSERERESGESVWGASRPTEDTPVSAKCRSLDFLVLVGTTGARIPEERQVPGSAVNLRLPLGTFAAS